MTVYYLFLILHRLNIQQVEHAKPKLPLLILKILTQVPNIAKEKKRCQIHIHNCSQQICLLHTTAELHSKLGRETQNKCFLFKTRETQINSVQSCAICRKIFLQTPSSGSSVGEFFTIKRNGSQKVKRLVSSFADLLGKRFELKNYSSILPISKNTLFNHTTKKEPCGYHLLH